MIDFLSEYGLFLAKVLTFVVAFLIIAFTVFALSHKNKSPEGMLVITHLNKKTNEIREVMQSEMLSKPEWKKWLKSLKKSEKEKKKLQKDPQGRLFVLRFDGDIRASATEALRESISAILGIANRGDEVLIVLESAGGFVQNYGLAASQLQRIRAHNLLLTAAIDKCAASGGYLMACVANKILAAPFALVGSIGVVAQLPNFHRLLRKNDIDYEMHTAGEYKRTLTLFGENTDKGREKFQEDLEETHRLFKEFISIHRPIVDLSKVANGDHWHAAVAKKMNLVDDLLTSDDYILEKINDMEVFEISYEKKETFTKKLFGNLSLAFEKGLFRLMTQLSRTR
jgi:serine protease SohB